MGQTTVPCTYVSELKCLIFNLFPFYNNPFEINHSNLQRMLPFLRHLRPHFLPSPLSLILPSTTPFVHHVNRSYATSSSTSDRTADRVPTNDSQPPPDKANVSESNAVESGVSTRGVRDAPFREEVADAERQRQLQAPNRAEVWSRSQQPRAKAMTGPRFEQTIMELQVSVLLCTIEPPERWRWDGKELRIS